MSPKSGSTRFFLNMLKHAPSWEWPGNARKTLQNVLQDRNVALSDRTTAAGLAGDLTVMDDETAGLLVAILLSSDEPEEIRAAAAISLGPVLEQTSIEGFDDEMASPAISEQMFQRIQETLRDTYLQEQATKLVRRRALEASVRAPDVWHRDAIRTANSSGDEEWILTAVFAMRWVQGFDTQILQALESPNADIHYEAVRAAGAHELSAAWPHVRALITSERTGKELRLTAIEAAGGMAPPEEVHILHELADSPDEEIADAANEALMFVEHGPDEEDEES